MKHRKTSRHAKGWHLREVYGMDFIKRWTLFFESKESCGSPCFVEMRVYNTKAEAAAHWKKLTGEELD